jgi:hypothetical protein
VRSLASQGGQGDASPTVSVEAPGIANSASDRETVGVKNGASQNLRTARNFRETDKGVERLKNGQVDQQIRRRPRQADALPRTTDGFGPSHSFGLRDSQSSPPKAVGRPSGRRSNSYHANSSVIAEPAPNSTNGQTGEAKASWQRTAWELPDLIQPLHRKRTRHVSQPRHLAHYPAVVEFVYNHRYATGFQIQRRFEPYMASDRTRQYQLAALEQLGYLQQAPVRSTSPNFPTVYAATRQGIGLIKATYAKFGRTWQGEPTEQLKAPGLALDSVLHEVLLTELDEMVRLQVQGRGDLALLLQERRYFRADKALRFEALGREQRLEPDAGFLLRWASAQGPTCKEPGRLQMNFVEFDNGTMSIAKLRSKLQAYSEWSRSAAPRCYFQELYESHGGSDARPCFRLLLVMRHPTSSTEARRLADVCTLGLGLARPMRERIWLTSLEMLRQLPVNEQVWLRLRDARGWLPQMPPLNSGRDQFLARRKFVAQHLPQLPRHPLLPRA